MACEMVGRKAGERQRGEQHVEESRVRGLGVGFERRERRVRGGVDVGGVGGEEAGEPCF